MVWEVSDADNAIKFLERIQLKTKKDVITMSVTTPFIDLNKLTTISTTA